MKLHFEPNLDYQLQQSKRYAICFAARKYAGRNSR